MSGDCGTSDVGRVSALLAVVVAVVGLAGAGGWYLTADQPTRADVVEFSELVEAGATRELCSAIEDLIPTHGYDWVHANSVRAFADLEPLDEQVAFVDAVFDACTDDGYAVTP